MKCFPLFAAICAVALSAETTKTASAATITDIITFTASGFEAGAPVDPVIGSFTVTFDPTATEVVIGTSVVVNSINVAGGGTPFFLWAPSSDFGAVLTVCSSADPFPMCGVGAGENSYLIGVEHFESTPRFHNVAYGTTSNPVQVFETFYWLDIDYYRPRSWPGRRCWTSWTDLGKRWPHRLVATAEEDRLNIRHNAQVVCGQPPRQ